jgi:predicted RNase H-like nuclease
VFPPPGRAALSQNSYRAASETNLAEIGKKLNRQTWNILPKIREVDSFLRENSDARSVFREVHPEVCFRAFNGGKAIGPRKKTPEGKRARLALLRKLDGRTDAIRDRAMDGFLRREVAEDDIHDALVAAISATNFPDGLVSVPSVPEFDAEGLPMAVVYAQVGGFGQKTTAECAEGADTGRVEEGRLPPTKD